jgi:hypothetical protein
MFLLWVVQAGGVFVNILFKPSLNFDYDLTQAIPEAAFEAKSTYVPEQVLEDGTVVPATTTDAPASETPTPT